MKYNLLTGVILVLCCAALVTGCDEAGKQDRNRSNFLYKLIADSSAHSSVTSIYVDSGTVYAGGSYSDGFKSVPCYWTGTARTALPVDRQLQQARVTSIFVTGGTVYAGGGFYDGALWIPCYWTASVTGTARTDLAGDGLHDAFVNSIRVSGAMVYTAGHYFDGIRWIPCYWTDSVRTDLPGYDIPGDTPDAGVLSAYAQSVYVSGVTVYTGGQYKYFDGTNYLWVPCYWTGTTRTDLPGGTTSLSKDLLQSVQSITVSGVTVYTGGYYHDGAKYVPCYWTNAARTDLAGDGINNAFVMSINYSSLTVYTGGYFYDGTITTPCYWAGATRTDLVTGTTGGGGINAIFEDSGTVYTGGYYMDGEKVLPACWAGATMTPLPGDGYLF